MKTVVVECKFVIEIPWELTEPEYSTEDHIRFCIEENSCPGTRSVGRVLDEVMAAAEESSICWACKLGGENKILAIEDRAPRDYRGEIQFKTTERRIKCPSCGAEVSETTMRNSTITKISHNCQQCNSASHSVSMWETPR